MGNFVKKGWIAGLLALLITLLLILPATSTFAAGTVRFDDRIPLLSAADKSAIQDQVKGLQFDILILTTNQYNSAARTEFQQYVNGQTRDPKTLTIGISNSATLKNVVVYAGTGLGITSSEIDRVRDAGTTSFTSQQWRSGIISIINQAKSSSSFASSGGGSMWIGWIVFIGIVVVIIVMVAAARRRSANNPAQPVYANPVQQQYMPQQPMYGPPPGYAPGYGYDPNYGRQRGGGLGSVIGGAAVGYILGEALSGGHHQGGGYNNPGSGGNFGGGDNDIGSSSAGGDFGGGGGDFGGGGDSGGGGGDF